MSGLKINLSKFEMVPIGEVATISVLAEILDCKVSSLPTEYLASPLGLRITLRPVWIEGGVKGSRVEFAKNRLILDQLYSIPPPSPSIQMDHKGYLGDSSNSLAVMASFVLPNVYGSNTPPPPPSLIIYL